MEPVSCGNWCPCRFVSTEPCFETSPAQGALEKFTLIPLLALALAATLSPSSHAQEEAPAYIVHGVLLVGWSSF